MFVEQPNRHTGDVVYRERPTPHREPSGSSRRRQSRRWCDPKWRPRHPLACWAAGLLGCIVVGGGVFAAPPEDQEPAPAPQAPAASGNDATAPAQPSGQTAGKATATPSAETPAALVIEVDGTVERAEAGASPLAQDGWTPVRAGDRLLPGTQLRTGLRSHVNLRFGETTFVSVRSATHASIDDFYRSATTENVRIGLGYGTVRGSSSEGEFRSEVTVDATVATLAKRGTEGWEMFVEPFTGRFRISLARSGLVEAVRKLRGGRRLSRMIAPGEYATANTIANMWIAQAVFDRNVTFYDASSVTATDTEFTTFNESGLGAVAPGGGAELTSLARRAEASAILSRAALDRTTPISTAVIQPGLLVRPEGNFGTPDTFRLFLPRE